jgi:predicted DNA-binding transcriptional regulator YafY
MSQTERILFLDKKMQPPSRGVTALEAAEHFEVSTRQIKRDIEYLRNRFNAPVIYDKALRLYRYEEEFTDLKFANQGLILSYLSIQSFVKNKQYFPLFEDSVLDQIMNEVPRDYLDVSSKITYQLPTVENIRPEYFECICSSVRDRICLDVEYENVKGDRSRRLVETEQLINYSGAWYIVAFDRKNEAVRTFNVSRITSLSLSKEKFSQHGSEYEKELRDFLNSGFGIFHGKSSQIVKVEFTGEAARIVKTQTWHEKQVMEISENLPGQECLTLEFPAANFTELVGKILSFGKKARPLEPPELVDLWKEEILGMKKMFD